MTRVSALLPTAALLLVMSIAYPASSAVTAAEVVNLRMKLYNEHRVDAMLLLYADDVEIYTYPDRLLGKGKVHLRGVLEGIFADQSVRVTVLKQLAKDSYVVNEEAVSYSGKPALYVSIYEVRNGLIQSVRFVRD